MADSAAFIISYILLGFLVISPFILVFFWKDYYFKYNNRLLFVIGLIFSRSLTQYSITNILAWFFIYYNDSLVTSSILSNTQSSLSSLLVIFMAHAADSYVGRFYTLLFSNTAYIGGLMLLWLFNPYDIIWLDVISLALISLGTSGVYILEDVIKDVVNHIDALEDRDEERSLARAETWLRLAHVSGSLSAILWVAVDAVGGVLPSWESSVLICIIAMTATSIIFCKGHKHYHQGELTRRPSQIFFRVIGNGNKKLSKYMIPRCCLKSPRPDKPIQNIETEKLDYLKIPKERRTTRYLDTKGKEPKAGSTSHEQADMVIVKSLLRMFPMWVMFFVVSIMSATGATFFYLQYSNLNVTHNIPIQIYSVVQGFSSFVIPVLYNKINRFSENEKMKKEKVQIGIGMLCGIFSCIFAWRLEVHRLKEVGYPVNKLNTSINFLWLVPQFCVLGCMEGLTRKGVLELYTLRMTNLPDLIDYGNEYIEIVMGLGYLMNIILLIVFNSLNGWFGYTINESRLDKYYKVLICVCSVNFVLYCCIARCYYKDQVMDSTDREQENQDLADDDH